MVGGGPCGNQNPDQPPAATPIMLQQVSSTDGITPIGDAVKILDRDDRDGPLVEAPSLVAVQCSTSSNGYTYVLFFSSNCYSTTYYDVSYATSVNGITGGGAMYSKSSMPLMTSTDGKGLNSPGKRSALP